MPKRQKHQTAQHTLPPGRFKALYEKALEPPRADAGTPYDVDQSTIDQVAKPPKLRQKRRTVDEREAALEVCTHNEVLRKVPDHGLEAEAIRRLNDLFNRDMVHLGPDLIFKAFRDLDTVFFAGHLFRYVDVRWSPSVTHMAVYGHVEHGENGTAHIIMDANKCFLQSRELNPYLEVFETLLHEMTHTLSYVRSHNGHAECHTDCVHLRGKCGHGQWFRLMLHSIHRRAARLAWLKEVIKPGYAPDYKEDHPMSDDWRET